MQIPPEQKAQEIYDAMYNELFQSHSLRPRLAKRCALIAVFEIIKATPNEIRGYKDGSTHSLLIPNPAIDYYQQVKQCIEKL